MQIEQKLRLSSDFDKKFKQAINKIVTEPDTMENIQLLLTETRRQIKQAFELGL